MKFLNFLKQRKDYFSEYDSNYMFAVISHQHQEIFTKYKSIHYGEDIALVASGSTLNQYNPIENCIHIGVNKVITRKDIKFDYFFIQDYSGSKDYINEVNNFNGIKFYGRQAYHRKNTDTVQGCIPEFEIENAKANLYYTSYPFHQFKYDIRFAGLADYKSIVFAATHFALWTRPKRIFLVGCDCSNLYFDKAKGKDFSYLKKGWEDLKKFKEIYYPDTEIISINPIGLTGLFKDKFTEK